MTKGKRSQISSQLQEELLDTSRRLGLHRLQTHRLLNMLKPSMIAALSLLHHGAVNMVNAQMHFRFHIVSVLHKGETAWK